MRRFRPLAMATTVLASVALFVLPSPASAAQLVVNGGFSNGTANWWNTANTGIAAENGRLRVNVTGGTANPWDAMVGQSDLAVTTGTGYVLSFDASASAPVSAVVAVQLGAAPYTSTLTRTLALSTATQRFSFSFSSAFSSTITQVVYQLGRGPGFTFYLDNVTLTSASDPIGMTNGFYVDPNSNPALWVAANPGDSRRATIQNSLSSKPMARWFGNWSGDITSAVSSYVGAADAADRLPVLVAYNIPGRDACGGHSGGGAGSPEAYRAWITAFTNGLGSRPAVVVIEPDSLGDFGCMDPAAIASRNAMLLFATQQFRDRAPNTWAYLDGGNAGWVAADVMAQRLHTAGVGNIRGFALNVSNYYTTAQSTSYGSSVSASLQSRYGYGKPFVVDTSRNANGSNGQWCNPAGRRIGAVSQVGGGAEMLVWIKIPGDSDGPCGIAPTTPAGTFSPDLAVRLINGT
jgi:endoglucanase